MSELEEQDRLFESWRLQFTCGQDMDWGDAFVFFKYDWDDVRLREIFDCCGEEYSEELYQRFMHFQRNSAAPYGYHLPLTEQRQSPDKLLELARLNIQEIYLFAKKTNNLDLSKELENLSYEYYEDKDKFEEMRLDSDTTSKLIYDTVLDYVSDHYKVKEGWRYILDEAYYGLAADYFIAAYLQMPILDIAPMTLEPYFNLWKAGGEYVVKDNIVYVSV